MKNETKPSVEDVISRGVANIIEEQSLRIKLKSGRPLRIKHGIDPTTKSLHLGYLAVYKKLREFQLLGDKIIFLIGDFTARFGDPDGQGPRRLRTREEVRRVAKTYMAQLKDILDTRAIELRYNGEWYDRMKAEDFLRIASNATLAQITKRELFENRIKRKIPIGMHELFYPLLQGYDSVMLKADIAICGEDQLFNELQGRVLQKAYGQQPQDVFAVELLIGTDGKRKMSQSIGNTINISEGPDAQFGKIMSLADDQIAQYFRLLTRVPIDKIEQYKKDIAKGRVNPMEIKLNLAELIVSSIHGPEKAERAREEFLRVFRGKAPPADMPEYKLKGGRRLDPLTILTKTGLAASKSEAKRLIIQGAVSVDGERLVKWDEGVFVKKGSVWKVGKRRFARIL